MDVRIIVDSCCDLTRQLKEKIDAISIPLTMRLGMREYVDDDTLNLDAFMEDMKSSSDAATSASPSPYLYQRAMEGAECAYVVTLSSQLSGSYENALMGKTFAEELPGSDVHVFDSKSAAAGETLVALKIHEMAEKCLPRKNIIETVERFIYDMKTYFVLENYDNLQKNGRLSRVKGAMANILNIKLLMGTDDEGGICLYAKPRGTRQMIDKMLSLIQDSGRDVESSDMVISHCRNADLSEKLAEAVRERFPFRNIYIVPTGGLSSMYTDVGGVVMAF